MCRSVVTMSILNTFIRNCAFTGKNRILQRIIPRFSVIPKRLNSDNSNKSDLSNSTILMQDGLTVQELPVLVRTVKNELYPHDKIVENTTNNSSKYTEKESSIHQMINKEFLKCSTLDDVYALLSKCSTITSNIALGALEHIYYLFDSSNSINGEVILLDSTLMDKLCNIISLNEDVYAIMRALNVVASRNESYLNLLCDELLKRVYDNKLSVLQVCDIIAFFGKNNTVKKYSSNIEKLWVGLVGKEKEFDEEKLIKCFSILCQLKASRNIILKVLERRMSTLWWQMKPENTILVLKYLIENEVMTSKILPILGRWTNTNIHVLSEDDLLEIIVKFTSLRYHDAQIEKALERYIKVKGLNINLDMLVVAIMNYISSFRIRNSHILSGCAEYFIANSKYLNPMFVKPILFPFGYLCFQPSNGLKFWQAVETVLEENFSKISMEDILNIMMSCIYLEKYPLNFIPNVFNPNFLERVNVADNSHSLKCKLKILDTAMTLECKAYKGPILPKYRNPIPIWHDGRIKRLVNHIHESLIEIAGGEDCLSTFVILPHMFVTDLYLVDVMIHPKDLRNSILNLNLSKDRNVNVALLINVPEHFCSNGHTLVGPQTMRIKHLRLLGLKVVNLKYDVLSRLKIHRNALNDYIIKNLKQAQSAY